MKRTEFKGYSIIVFFIAFLTTNVAFGETFNVTTPEEFQSALTEAQSNEEDDTINVAAGTYNITSTLHYSSYDGDSGHKLTIQGAGADKTVLDGRESVQILYINTDADYNSGDSSGDVTIKGMAFENGNGGDGGGVYVHGSSINITIKECTFSGNSADYGGGVYAYSDSGTITITNNTFSGNSADYWGGGVYARGVYARGGTGTVNITNNTFSGNSALDGGGVDAYSGTGTVNITNNTFSGNSASHGGGVWGDSGSGTVTITNNTLSGNSADYGAGVYAYSDSGTITIANNTFSKNSADDHGAGVYVRLMGDSATSNIYNNILFGNTTNADGNDGDDLYVNSDGDGNYIGSTINLYNNDFSGNADFDTGQSEDLYITLTDNYHHANNIQKDPQFVDSENGDFHLKPSSPCIDKGTADAPELPDTDFEGDPRIVGAAPDIGADEVVTKRLPGDCNDDGTVSIDEVQKCINCFLGIENDCCDKCDVNSNGQVTIDEVQKAINAFLGIV